jgi:hypothetical protein
VNISHPQIKAEPLKFCGLEKEKIIYALISLRTIIRTTQGKHIGPSTYKLYLEHVNLVVWVDKGD